MPHEGLCDCAGGVVTGGNEDGVFGETVNKDDQELVVSIWRQRPHNVNGEGIPWSLRRDGARRLLAMTIIGAQLALWAALDDLQTDAATCFMGMVVTEVSTKRGRRGGWQHAVRGRFFWLLPHLPAGELEGGYLQGAGGRRASG